MSKLQQAHFLDNFGRHIHPSPERTEPVLWFQELRLLDRLSPEDVAIRRRFDFRPGLNILWAEPEDPGENEALYRDGLGGHATGKTLFCRILRHLIGEPNFCTKVLLDAVHGEFPELWAVASIRVASVTWIVGRSLAGPGNDFAAKAPSIDAVLAGTMPPLGEYGDFTTAIAKECAGSVTSLYPNDPWRHLLPWLARDQEARFASIHEWREGSSEADNPISSAQNRQLLMRAVLGLLSGQEPDLRNKLTEANIVREQEEQKQPSFQREAHRTCAVAVRLVKALLPHTPDDADLTALAAQLGSGREVRQQWLNQQKLKPDTTEVKKAKTDFRTASHNLDTAKAQITAKQQQLGSMGAQRAQMMAYVEKGKKGGLVSGSQATAGWCPNSLLKARERNCVQSGPPDPESTLQIEDLVKNAQGLGSQIDGIKTEVAKLESSLERLELVESQMSDALNTVQAQATAEAMKVSKEVVRFDTATLAIEDALEIVVQLDASKKAMNAAVEKIEEIKGKLAVLRQQQDDVRKVFSEIFADIIQAVMGATIEAKVSLGERGLETHAERDRELAGAALETIKTLAFDIAAIVASIEGRGSHPRFLIHDGPREADMARVIYGRFFIYAKKIEDSFTAGNVPSFQYILTTTTPPPPSMQRGSKWLLGEVLDSKTPEKRLLKKNL